MMPRPMVLVALVVASACDKGEPPPRLFDRADVDRLESALLAQLDANQRRSCPRPVLRGEPLPGSGTPAMRALLESEGELGDCIARLREAPPAPPGTPLDPTRADLVALDRACGALLEAAVTAAVRHADSCSPYQTGTGFMDSAATILESPATTMFVIAKALAVRARLAADAGDGVAALWLLADGVRLTQDLSRGHVSLLTWMISRGTAAIMLEQVAVVLSTLRDVPPELTTAFDLLLATEPAPGGVFAGETQWMALHFGAARLHPASWPVPGGRDTTTFSADREPWGRDKRVAVLDDAGILLAIADWVRANLDMACGSSLAACVRTLEALQRETVLPINSAEFGNLIASYAKQTTDRGELRARVVHAAALVHVKTFPDYASKRAQMIAALAGARIALEAKRRGRCPTQDELDAPPFTALRAPVTLGDTVRARVDAGTLTIEAPAWPTTEMGRGQWAWTTQCP